MDKRRFLRAAFRIINRFIVVPAFQNNLGKLISNPLTGDIMVLGISGRKTGKIRYTPVSFARMAERIYCYQGKEMKGQWYLNLLANPKVEVLLPEGRFLGRSERVNDASERLAAIRALLKVSGLSKSMYGFDPADAPDDVVAERTEGIPVIRITID
jgi:deazaflavin-dependent oxidoreductase (nitroreductase family)